MATMKLAYCLSTLVAGALASGSSDAYYSSVTAGQGFSCGVLEETGRVECWGDGALPVDDPSLDAIEAQLMDVNHKSISGGGFHVCGLYYDGEERGENLKAYCVGSFKTGEVQDKKQLEIPELESGLVWKEMSAGGMHSCGIDSDRMVTCWGSEDGNRRNLGDYATMKHRHISAGGVTTCGVLMDRTGYCVGDVPQGMLPAEYEKTKFRMLEAGGAFTYGLIKGSRELIKFGPGAGELIPTTPPSGFRSAKTLQIAAGAAHVCAMGRRNRKAIGKEYPAKGAWCAGTGTTEITGISVDA